MQSNGSPQFVNTSLHGVGHAFLKEAFETLNLPLFVPVVEQQEPDPDFPTVEFPNPEETGLSALRICHCPLMPSQELWLVVKLICFRSSHHYL